MTPLGACRVQPLSILERWGVQIGRPRVATVPQVTSPAMGWTPDLRSCVCHAGLALRDGASVLPATGPGPRWTPICTADFAPGRSRVQPHPNLVMQADWKRQRRARRLGIPRGMGNCSHPPGFARSLFFGAPIKGRPSAFDPHPFDARPWRACASLRLPVDPLTELPQVQTDRALVGALGIMRKP